MANVLQGMAYMQAMGDRGTARRKENSLAQLAGDYAAGGQPDYQGIAQNGGDPMKFRQDSEARLGQFAALIVNAPEAMRPQLWQQIRPQVEQFAPGSPEQWTPEILPMAQQFAQQFGGQGQAGTGVQSSFVDAQGRRMAIMRDGSVRELGQNAPNMQIMEAQGGIVGINKSDLTASPVTMGGAPPQAPQSAGGIVFDDQTLQSLLSVPASERPTMFAAMQGGGATFHPGANGEPVRGPSAGSQLQPAPKPVAPRAAPAGYSWKPDGSLSAIPGGPAQAAIDARQAALDAKKTAGQVRQAEAAGQASSLIAAIDRLTGSEGFSDLGTTWGDIKQNTPLIRNDAKDSNAQLRNIAGQIALTTMSRLKALSAVGATGFGALTAPELKLLENSLAALQSDEISNKELSASLKIIKDSMQKIADWKGDDQGSAAAPASGPKVGQVEDGHRFKGGNPADPNSWEAVQ